jgi:hypothetical protein
LGAHPLHLGDGLLDLLAGTIERGARDEKLNGLVGESLPSRTLSRMCRGGRRRDQKESSSTLMCAAISLSVKAMAKRENYPAPSSLTSAEISRAHKALPICFSSLQNRALRTL